MLMHMPRKLAIPVMLAVAACLGAYFVWLSRPARLGEWRVYQGTGRVCVEEEDGVRRREYLDVSYTVRDPAKPLFSYRPSASIWRGADPVIFEYRSDRAAVMRVVWVEGGVAVHEERLELRQTGKWLPAVLSTGPGGDAAPEAPRTAGAWRIDFYDRTAATSPTAGFSNRVTLTPPVLRIPRSPVIID